VVLERDPVRQQLFGAPDDVTTHFVNERLPQVFRDVMHPRQILRLTT
jgi:hypothetical protein